MCVPHKKSRKKLKDVVQTDSHEIRAKEVITPCQEEPKEEPKPLPPVLISLDVKRAVALGDDTYARGVAVGRFVEFEVTTLPNTPEAWAQLTWAPVVPALQDGGAANKKRLPRDAGPGLAGRARPKMRECRTRFLTTGRRRGRELAPAGPRATRLLPWRASVAVWGAAVPPEAWR